MPLKRGRAVLAEGPHGPANFHLNRCKVLEMVPHKCRKSHRAYRISAKICGAPNSKTRGWIEKCFGGKKIVSMISLGMQSFLAITRCTPAWEQKVGCLFVCLSFFHAVTSSAVTSRLHRIRRYRDLNAVSVVDCKLISTRFSALFSGRNALSSALNSSQFHR